MRSKNSNFAVNPHFNPSLEPRLVNLIKDNDMYVLRDSKTNHAINVSFSPDGLLWTTNDSGRLICFENGRIAKTIDLKKSIESGEAKITSLWIGSTDFDIPRRSKKVYIEKFIPREQATARGKIAEYTSVNKAYRLLRLNTGVFEA